MVLASRTGQNGIGAGTVVQKTGTHIRVITAGHVATFGALQLRLTDGSTVPARLVALVPGRDLAVIEADLRTEEAAQLTAAPIAVPRAAEAVHVWGSGNDGPAYETGKVGNVGATLPDGTPRGRYALGCALCHKGDSGAGVFNVRGELVGIYIGYFEVEAGRLSIAEQPGAAVAVARIAPSASENVAFAGGPVIEAASGAASGAAAPEAR